jgi:phage terminase small subunit
MQRESECPEKQGSKKKLTLKQQRFVDAYLETGNATEAARRAGYQASEDALRVIGHENLTKLNIQRRIESRVADSQVTANEVIGTLASQMRGDITEILADDGSFDVEAIRRKKLGHLSDAMEALCDVMRDGKGSERVSAAKAIRGFATRGIEVDDHEQRLKEIEARLAKQNGKK